MKISPYLHINRIEFMTTYFCTGKCRHCSVGDDLGKRDGFPCVKTDEAVAAIKELSQAFEIKSLMTFGGEPLIYPEFICAVHAAAREAGIGRKQIITNGYFSRDKGRIWEVAQNIIESGVNEVLLSVDAFHEDRIPLEYVMEFARALVENGIQRFKLSPAWVINEAADNEYNRRTRKIIAQFDGMGIEKGSGNDIFMAGNAKKYLAEFYPPPALDLNQKCGEMPYTSPPTDVDSVSIEPNGDMVACNLVMGNIYNEKVADIIARYDPTENPLVCALLEGGARGLVEKARDMGIDVDTSDCYSVCDVCRKVMR